VLLRMAACGALFFLFRGKVVGCEDAFDLRCLPPDVTRVFESKARPAMSTDVSEDD
jgi:hypothetical protein